ncbi:class I SAM-dependent methyltransferase [Thermopolyspora sp. NPDC052614]|uniref:class I SAM-dependent methyltransferase n=1 Tax=Thermopolyspora sp. NPDC052614 TaxID=3155682 RepID=UPI003427B5B8
MPTIPPQRVHPLGDQPHLYRQAAESFGARAERYDRARPRYPDAMVEAIVKGSPGPAVLDVGCGTGIAARQFQAAGCRVLGVDVDERMAELARRDGIEVEVSTFESWDPAGRRFDAVISAQAWHWVEPVAGAAKAAQVLPPGGRLAAFWNVAQPPPEVADAFAAVHERVLPEMSFHRVKTPPLEGYSPLFAKTADGVRQTGAFAEPEQWRFDWDRFYTRDEWLDVLPTHGIYAQLPPDKMQELLEDTGAAIDALGGGFTMRYAAVVATALRIDAR